MKTVFSSNSQVAHVWAQQTQGYGKSENLFFRENKIYSYGTHYLAAQIFTINGKKVCVINSDRYSVSTAKHLNEISSAVRNLMTVIHLPDTETYNSQKNHEYLKARFESIYTNEEKTIKVTSQSSVDCSIENIAESLNKINIDLKTLGFRQIKIDTKRIAAIKKHLEFRLKRYQELNTPEMIAKKAAVKEQKTKDALSRAIAKFYDGANIAQTLRHSLQFDLLRVQDKEVVTSGGARVPLFHAKLLLDMLKGEIDIVGKKIGHFTVDDVKKLAVDTVIEIGCHKILLSEAEKVLGTA